MPCDYSNYPANWKTEIRPRILERAGHKCEFCGKPNYAMVWQTHGFTSELADVDNDWWWTMQDPNRYSRCRCYWYSARLKGGQYYKMPSTPNGMPFWGPIRVVLTIAHLDHDITNNEDGNLAALCQRCHNILDAPSRARKRKNGHGQEELF